jgi:hypothetical protein
MNYTIQDKRRTATPLFPNTKLSDATTHTELQGQTRSNLFPTSVPTDWFFSPFA